MEDLAIVPPDGGDPMKGPLAIVPPAGRDPMEGPLAIVPPDGRDPMEGPLVDGLDEVELQVELLQGQQVLEGTLL